METQKGAQVFIFIRQLHKRYRELQDDESACPETNRELFEVFKTNGVLEQMNLNKIKSVGSIETFVEHIMQETELKSLLQGPGWKIFNIPIFYLKTKINRLKNFWNQTSSWTIFSKPSIKCYGYVHFDGRLLFGRNFTSRRSSWGSSFEVVTSGK